MEFSEFSAIYNEYAKERDIFLRTSWEQARIQSYYSLVPYLNKGTKITPESLVPLPWDEANEANEKAPQGREMTPEEQRKRMDYLMKL